MVDKLVLELETQLEANKVTFELDDAARRYIADKGYDPKMGARPMARVIQEQIKRPLAEQLLFGDLVAGGHVTIVINDDGELDLIAVPDTRQLEHLANDEEETGNPSPAHSR